jgi:hypothetical protein
MVSRAERASALLVAGRANPQEALRSTCSPMRSIRLLQHDAVEALSYGTSRSKSVLGRRARPLRTDITDQFRTDK